MEIIFSECRKGLSLKTSAIFVSIREKMELQEKSDKQAPVHRSMNILVIKECAQWNDVAAYGIGWISVRPRAEELAIWVEYF